MSPSEPAPELPPGRYGQPRRMPRWVAITLVVLGFVALVPVARAMLQTATPDVRGVVTAFSIDGPTRVTATVDVTKPIDATAVCVLRARDRYSDAVGTTRLVVSDPVQSVVVRRSFPTSAEAVVVEVTGCEVDESVEPTRATPTADTTPTAD